MCSGPTGSGKSEVIRQLLENAEKFIDPIPVECIFNYGVWQSNYEKIRCPFPIRFVEGVSKLEDLPKDGVHRIWVLDDLLQDVSDSKAISDVYTKFSHHLNYSVVVVSQNLFERGRHFRTINLNTQYLWLLKLVRDSSIILTLGRQMRNSKFLANCYEKATSIPYGHLFIDLKPGSDDRYRVRAQMFDSPSVVFLSTN